MPSAFAFGLATVALDLQQPSRIDPGAAVLDTYYPVTFLQQHAQARERCAEIVGHAGGSASYRLTPELIERLGAELAELAGDEPHGSGLAMALRSVSGVSQVAPLRSPLVPVLTLIDDIAAPAVDAADVYLRLHLLSQRKVAPHGINVSGIFALLSNVAWTNHGPFAVSQVDCLRAQLRAQGERLQVSSVDKFPRMSDYVVPTGVRIADAERVRLGAHLAEGTTVMHEGFVNFNAGTLGSSMVEGRISAGVVVDDGSDIGGGASIMGTLSGGGSEVIRVGKGCLVGANAGIGISLGDRCTVEAGTYITAAAKIRCPDGSQVKAATLSGRDDCLFRRNSLDGALEVIFKANAVALNEALHKN